MFSNHLYLASTSKTRRALLDCVQINYKIIEQTSDECGIDTSLSFHDYVLAIAKQKMDHIVLENITDEKTIFVLTSDTLVRTAHSKKILGKPENIEHAKQMLALSRKEPIELATGCCLDKKEFCDGTWKTIAKEHWVTPVNLEFCVDEELVDLYLEKTPHALKVCGAGMIEDFGMNFLKRVDGSYSAIIGLPIFELRQALKKLGFN